MATQKVREKRRTMREWSVRFGINRPDLVFTEDHVDTIVSTLGVTHAASASYSPHELSVRFTLVASRPLQAVQEGFKHFTHALQRAGIPGPEESIVEAEIDTVEDMDRELKEPNIPELAGVTEVARILGISKQRVSTLARDPDFPRPIEMLAAGPVWKKVAILRHVGLWPRKPGRPRKSLSA